MTKAKTGFDAVVEMFNHLDGPTRERLLRDLAQKDPKLVEALNQKMYLFEDLLLVESKDLQTLLKEIPTATLALALRKVTPELKAHIFKSISKRAQDILDEEIQALGPRKVSDVEAAQTQIRRKLIELESEKKVSPVKP